MDADPDPAFRFNAEGDPDPQYCLNKKKTSCRYLKYNKPMHLLPTITLFLVLGALFNDKCFCDV